MLIQAVDGVFYFEPVVEFGDCVLNNNEFVVPGESLKEARKLLPAGLGKCKGRPTKKSCITKMGYVPCYTFDLRLRQAIPVPDRYTYKVGSPSVGAECIGWETNFPIELLVDFKQGAVYDHLLSRALTGAWYTDHVVGRRLLRLPTKPERLVAIRWRNK